MLWKSQLRKPYTQKCTKEYLVLLSHCRTVEEAAQRSTSALQEHMAERQVSHSKMQLLTEVESSALKVFGAYSLIMSSNVNISNNLISNSIHNKKSFRNTGMCSQFCNTQERHAPSFQKGPLSRPLGWLHSCVRTHLHKGHAGQTFPGSPRGSSRD